MGKSHFIIGTAVSLSAASLAGMEVTVPAAAAAMIGSLLPDIDEPNSMLVRSALPAPLVRLLQAALIALAVCLLTLDIAPRPWNIPLAVTVAAASFMPGRRLRKLLMVLIALGLAAFAEAFAPWNAIAGGVLLLAAVVPHRGLTHTLYALAGWTALLYFAGTVPYEGGQGMWRAAGDSLWFAGGLAYALHLAADSLTKRGITPLPPLPFKLRLKLMSTGSKRGAAIEGVFVLLSAALFIYTFMLR